MLRHSTKKPGCGPEVFAYLKSAPGSNVTEPSHIAVVGDRLFTDVMMANMMGSWSVWLKDGVIEEKGLVSTFKLEVWNVRGLGSLGYSLQISKVAWQKFYFARDIPHLCL